MMPTGKEKIDLSRIYATGKGSMQNENVAVDVSG
jgi:hypothetical protein